MDTFVESEPDLKQNQNDETEHKQETCAELKAEPYTVVDEIEDGEIEDDEFENNQADDESENVKKNDSKKDPQNNEVDYDSEDGANDEAYNEEKSSELEVEGIENKNFDDEIDSILQEVPDETSEENQLGELETGDDDCIVIDENEDTELDIETHPYEHLIDNFQLTKDQTVVTNIGNPKSLKDTPLHLIHSKNQLVKLLSFLRAAKEISIDLFADMAQFKAVIYLMAISIRGRDYIIDGHALGSDLLLLTEIFINPNIVKIVDNSQKQLSKLQKTLRLFVVNVFDISLAWKALGKSSNNALKERFSVNMDNKVIPLRQLSQRPIPGFVKSICRTSAHYYINLYHDLKNELLKTSKELFNDVMMQCRESSKIIYLFSRTLDFGQLTYDLKNKQLCQSEVLKRLYDWRVKAARKYNQNPEVILPDHQLIKISATLPFTLVSLKLCTFSKTVEAEKEEVLAIISEAKDLYNIRDKRTPMLNMLDKSAYNIIGKRPQMNKPIDTGNQRGVKLKGLVRKVSGASWGESSESRSNSTRFPAPKRKLPLTRWERPEPKQPRTEVYTDVQASTSPKKYQPDSRFKSSSPKQFNPRNEPGKQTFRGFQQPSFNNSGQMNNRASSNINSKNVSLNRNQPQPLLNLPSRFNFSPGLSSSANRTFQNAQDSGGSSSRQILSPQRRSRFNTAEEQGKGVHVTQRSRFNTGQEERKGVKEVQRRSRFDTGQEERKGVHEVQRRSRFDTEQEERKGVHEVQRRSRFNSPQEQGRGINETQRRSRFNTGQEERRGVNVTQSSRYGAGEEERKAVNETQRRSRFDARPEQGRGGNETQRSRFSTGQEERRGVNETQRRSSFNARREQGRGVNAVQRRSRFNTAQEQEEVVNKALNVLDKKINTLEKKVSEFQTMRTSALTDPYIRRGF